MADTLYTCPFCHRPKLYVAEHKRNQPWYCHYMFCPGWDGKGTRQGVRRNLPSHLQEVLTGPSYQSSTPSCPPPHDELDIDGWTFLTKERQLEPWVLQGREITSTYKGILFEFFHFDYWQERRWPEYNPPKWKNKPGCSVKEEGISYLVDYQSNSTIVLVEGILDALSVGAFTPSAAMLSYTLHPRQIQRLKNLGFQRFIYVPDSDVPLKWVVRNLKVLAEEVAHWEHKELPAGVKDANELPPEERQEWVSSLGV